MPNIVAGLRAERPVRLADLGAPHRREDEQPIAAGDLMAFRTTPVAGFNGFSAKLVKKRWSLRSIAIMSILLYAWFIRLQPCQQSI
jgi:hypothetical protein